MNEAQVRATKRYKNKAWKRIPLDVRLEEYEQLKEYTDKTGQSINGFIRKTVREKIEKEGGYTNE